MGSERSPAVAGMFYPEDPTVLASEVGRFLSSAKTEAGEIPPKILIVPHAGYIYSGPIAASAYKLLCNAAGKIKRVVLLGPAHRVGFQGLAVPTQDNFRTPLGNVAIDQEAIASIRGLPCVVVRDDAHRDEHSLEVQLPFLQEVLTDFSLVPIVVGGATDRDVAQVVNRLWSGEETLILISSDLSHYENYDQAQRLDQNAAMAIEDLQPEKIAREQACGRLPIAGALLNARQRHMKVKRLDLRNSGDTAGPHDRVVGYGAWAIFENENVAGDNAPESDKEILQQYGPHLLKAVSASIRRGLEKGAPPEVDLASYPAPLQEHRATFVTLKKKDQLRGCIGAIIAHRPFINDVVANAYAAAFKDHRFPPLQKDELPDIRFSISLLGKPEPMTFSGEADFLNQLRPNIDGLIIEDQGKRSVFLPQVWEDLPDKAEFVRHLKHKAGLPVDVWSSTMKAWRFGATSLGAAD